jgi:predicted RNase H-related nuclease YkuK (DUF458 family)
MFTDKQLDELINLLCEVNSNTKIYIGSDSVRFKKDGERFFRVCTVCVVHMNGRNGCRVFKHRTTHRDYDIKKSRPSQRLMTEVMQTCELYTQLAPIIDGFDIEIHADINPDEKHGSSCVAQQAAGYILGVTGLPEDQIKLKPDAFVASFGADHFAHKMSEKGESR